MSLFKGRIGSQELESKTIRRNNLIIHSWSKSHHKMKKKSYSKSSISYCKCTWRRYLCTTLITSKTRYLSNGNKHWKSKNMISNISKSTTIRLNFNTCKKCTSSFQKIINCPEKPDSSKKAKCKRYTLQQNFITLYQFEENLAKFQLFPKWKWFK